MVKQGDIIKINFEPTKGSEQSGYRPAVVVSNNAVISKTNIVLLCPITSKPKPGHLAVTLDESTKTKGYVLCIHSRAVDLKVRPHRVVERLSQEKLNEILEVLVNIITPS